MTKLEKVLKLIFILSDGQNYQGKDLVPLLDNVGLRQLRVYIKDAQNAGVPIKHGNGRYGGYYLERGWFENISVYKELRVKTKKAEV